MKLQQNRTKRGALAWLHATVATFLIASGITIMGVAPVRAGTSTLCTGAFSNCINAGFTAHDYENHYTDNVHGPGVGYWRALPGHNCTNYVGYMLTQNGDAGPNVNMGNAMNWDNMINNNPSWGYSVNGTPAVGSIAHWEAGVGYAGSSGHVAYVEAVSQSGGITTITISEDNYPSGPFSWKTITSDGGDWPSNFLHIKDVPVATTPVDDFVIHRSSGGVGSWYVKKNENGTATSYLVNGTTHGGQAGDIPLTADFTGDGISDLVIYRIVGGAGTWYVKNGATGAQAAIWGATHGSPGDVPVVGDVTGDGYADFGIYRLEGGVTGTWYFKSGSTGQQTAIWGATHGSPGDVPIVGDFNGDNYADFGIYRVTGGTGYWYVKSSANGQQISSAWSVMHGGWTGDVPVVGDFNGDNYADFGIYRPSGGTGYWYVRSGVNTSTMVVNGATQGGWTGDVPLAGNF